MKYAYHYHAIHQSRPGEITNVDGIIEAAGQIDTMARYSQIKQTIADQNGFNNARVTICSLSFLHVTPNAQVQPRICQETTPNE